VTQKRGIALELVRVGLAGVIGRSGAFREALEAQGARVAAVCDARGEALETCRVVMGADGGYTDYNEMLSMASLDAVVIGSPQHLHAPQAATALKKGLHVLFE
jgi:predicted dehydrogenase